MNFQDYYNELKQDKNLISNWYPHVMNCGIKTPFTVILTTPVDVAQAFFVEDQEKDRETVYQWVKNSVIPVIYGNLEHLGNPLLFLKNGCFSNKFDASTCIARPIATELAIKIIEINYSAFQ